MKLLEHHFDTAFDAPDGIKKLRELILTLAIQGKLTTSQSNTLPIERVNLKDIALKIGSGSTPSGGRDSYATSGIPLIRSMNVHFGGFKVDGLAYINETQAEKLNNVVVREADVLLNITGASIGRVTLAPAAMEGARVNQHVCIIRPDKRVLPRYLEAYLASPLIQQLISEVQVGATREALTKSMIEQFTIELPSIQMQARIVARIDELMARCDALEKLRAERDAKRLAVHTAAVRQLLNVADTDGHIQARDFLGQHFGDLYAVKENVTELRKAILQLAVMGKLVPQDPNDAPASELLKQIEAEKKRLVKKGEIKEPKPLPPLTRLETPYEIPQSWQWVRMGELCNGITSGSTPSKEHIHDKDGIPFLKVYNIRNQMIDFAYKKQFVSRNYHQKTMARSRLTPGDVVMNIVGPPLGKTAIIPDEYQEYNCNQAIVVFRPIARATNRYLHTYLLAGRFLEGIELVGTAGQDNISVTKSQMMPIPLPPMEEQLRIVKCVRTLIGQCDTLEQQIDAARESQSALLNAMMAQYGGQQCA